MVITPNLVRETHNKFYEIESFLGPLAREVHQLRLAAKGKASDLGVLDSWDLDGEELTVRFFDYDDSRERVRFPLSWIEDNNWRAQLAQEIERYEAGQRILAEYAAKAAEQRERDQLAKLKEKYPDA